MGGFRKQRRLGAWRALSLHTWERPADPTVYGILELDATNALAYVEGAREATGLHVTITHLVGKAVALAIAACPDVNAVIRRGRHIYVRDTVDVFFQIALDGGKDLAGAKVSRANEKSVGEIATELADRSARVRAHRDRDIGRPQALLARLPSAVRGAAMRTTEWLTYDLGLDLRTVGIPYDSFGSAMVTNVGMFGLPLGFAPLVPFSRTPILLTLGAITDKPVAIDGEVHVRPVLPIGATFDHRLLDGHQAGQLAQRFTAVLRDPVSHLGPTAAAALSDRAPLGSTP